MSVIHVQADTYPYRPGTIIRTGKPWSKGRGSPFMPTASIASRPSMTSSTGEPRVMPSTDRAASWSARPPRDGGRTPAQGEGARDRAGDRGERVPDAGGVGTAPGCCGAHDAEGQDSRGGGLPVVQTQDAQAGGDHREDRDHAELQDRLVVLPEGPDREVLDRSRGPVDHRSAHHRHRSGGRPHQPRDQPGHGQCREAGQKAGGRAECEAGEDAAEAVHTQDSAAANRRIAPPPQRVMRRPSVPVGSLRPAGPDTGGGCGRALRGAAPDRTRRRSQPAVPVSASVATAFAQR